jgi:hypothetical protein
LKNSVANKKTTPLFQVLLLDNDASDSVAVQEADEVDFFQVEEHLRKGGSVFITSKCRQKLLPPKAKKQMIITVQEEITEHFSDCS